MPNSTLVEYEYTRYLNNTSFKDLSLLHQTFTNKKGLYKIFIALVCNQLKNTVKLLPEANQKSVQALIAFLNKCQNAGLLDIRPLFQGLNTLPQEITDAVTALKEIALFTRKEDAIEFECTLKALQMLMLYLENALSGKNEISVWGTVLLTEENVTEWNNTINTVKETISALNAANETNKAELEQKEQKQAINVHTEIEKFGDNMIELANLSGNDLNTRNLSDAVNLVRQTIKDLEGKNQRFAQQSHQEQTDLTNKLNNLKKLQSKIQANMEANKWPTDGISHEEFTVIANPLVSSIFTPNEVSSLQASYEREQAAITEQNASLSRWAFDVGSRAFWNVLSTVTGQGTTQPIDGAELNKKLQSAIEHVTTLKKKREEESKILSLATAQMEKHLDRCESELLDKQFEDYLQSFNWLVKVVHALCERWFHVNEKTPIKSIKRLHYAKCAYEQVAAGKKQTPAVDDGLPQAATTAAGQGQGQGGFFGETAAAARSVLEKDKKAAELLKLLPTNEHSSLCNTHQPKGGLPAASAAA